MLSTEEETETQSKKPKNTEVKVKEPEKSKKTQEEELYKYVLEDTNELEKFYEPKLSNPLPNDKFDNAYDIACDAQVAMETPSVPLKKKIKVKEENRGSYLTINEYADENALNGGQLFDGLNGFDGYGTMFEEYKC